MSNLAPFGSGSRVIPLPVATGVASASGGASGTAGVWEARGILAQPKAIPAMSRPEATAAVLGLLKSGGWLSETEPQA